MVKSNPIDKGYIVRRPGDPVNTKESLLFVYDKPDQRQSTALGGARIFVELCIDLSTSRTKWPLDGPG